LLLAKWFLPRRRAQNEIGIALVHNFEYVELSQTVAAADISAVSVDFCPSAATFALFAASCFPSDCCTSCICRLMTCAVKF